MLSDTVRVLGLDLRVDRVSFEMKLVLLADEVIVDVF